MKGISTVSILILTVFLSISVLPACADFDQVPGYPVTIFGYAESDGGPAVDATVTICNVSDASKCTTVQVGESFGTPGYWKANLAPIGVDDGDTVSISITTNDGSSIGSATYIVNTTSPEASQVSDIILRPKPPGDTDDSTTGGGSGSRDGTYPPGWGETPTPSLTPDATVAPASTDTTEPPMTTPTEEEIVTPGEAVTEGEAPAKETEPPEELKTPGFGAVFMIAGLLAAVYLVLRRRE
jgi:PGF-CTERM protein